MEFSGSIFLGMLSQWEFENKMGSIYSSLN